MFYTYHDRSVAATILYFMIFFCAISEITCADSGDIYIKPDNILESSVEFSKCFYTGCAIPNWYDCFDSAMKNPLSWEIDVKPYFYKTFEFTTPEEGWAWYEIESEVPDGAIHPIEVASLEYQVDNGPWAAGSMISYLTKNIMRTVDLAKEKSVSEAKIINQNAAVSPGTFVGPARWRITLQAANNVGCGVPYSLTGILPCTGKITVKFVPKSFLSQEPHNPTITPSPTPTDCSCTACFSAIAPSSRGSMASGEIPLTIEFKDCSYPQPVKWSWNFGDGKFSDEQNPVWVYQSSGIYEPSLSVTCKEGCTDSVSQRVEAWEQPETSCPVSFTIQMNKNNPKQVTQSPVIPCEGAQAVRWKFGDGFETEYLTTVDPRSPDPYTREYADYGNYTITMEVIFSTDTMSSSQTISVAPVPGTQTPVVTPTPGSPPQIFTTTSIISDTIDTFTVDSSGNMFEVDPPSGTVIKISADGSKKTIASGIDRPRFPVLDTSGNLYVGSYDGTVLKISPDGTKIKVSSNIWSPQGMGLDAQGTLYVASGYDGNIYRITSAGVIDTVSSGFIHPTYLAVAPEGDIYVADSQGTKITRITPEGGYATMADIRSPLRGLSLEGDTLYVSYQDTVARIDAFGAIKPILTGLDNPSWIVAKNGKIYVTLPDGTAMIQ